MPASTQTIAPPAPSVRIPEALPAPKAWRKTPQFSNSSIPILEKNLRGALQGEVRFDSGSRALYATDSSNYRQVPIGVVIPTSIDDIVATIEIARQYNAPILNRGGGTSLAGECCNIAVIMDMSKYLDHVLEIDPKQRYARVQPGTVLDTLRHEAEKYHLTYGPDPATHNHCTLGGMIGNNSCGVHSVMAGETDANVDELDIVTYRGDRMRLGRTDDAEYERILRAGGPQAEIYQKLKAFVHRYEHLIRKKFPSIPRRVSGYNLIRLLPEHGFHVARAVVGSESTLVTVLEAKVRLVESPPVRSLLVLGYPDIYSAADHVPELMQAKPIALEAIDHILMSGMEKKNLDVKDVDLLPTGKAWILLEFGGDTKEESDSYARRLMATLRKKDNAPSMKLFDNPKEEKRVWQVREDGLGASANVPGMRDTWEGWEDSAVDPSKLGSYLRDLKKLYEKYNYVGAFYGHFGQGCLHTRITFDLISKEGVKNFRSFLFEAAALVVSYDGTLSGEHGDGQSRGELLPIMFGHEMVEAFREFKQIWDPDWKMNPGKIVDPYGVDENLRYGADFSPLPLRTQFAYKEDHGSFTHAMMRCVGVGNCRRMHGGTMCPSYRATHEEKHSTRGRARLLWEMMVGEVLHDQWKEAAVKDALDLCLSCKGCKGDCPVNVDMATYKSEFLYHYYQGKMRPRTAYAFGLIMRWARLASVMSGMANFFTQTSGLRSIAKAIAGIAPQRTVPKFASQSFRSWFEKREAVNPNSPPVLLWPDTFNNYFHPQIAIAAVEVLEHAGFRVVIPPKNVCCGRPLYDYGMLERARKMLGETVNVLHPYIVDKVPMVGLEPSCLAVFLDEMVNILPENKDAEQLSNQAFTLAEFLEKKHATEKFGRAPAKVMLHGHCHQKALIGMHAEEHIMKKMGMEVNALDDGCCGMAGSFGFEKDHYDISQQVGELELLPRVRDADDGTLILADGFSCHEQVLQGTGKTPMHFAQLLRATFK